MVSIILSMFMTGLGLGSWIGGRACRRFGEQIGNSALRIYALLYMHGSNDSIRNAGDPNLFFEYI
jgi:hypothetical protein